MTKKSILITGASGAVGRAVLQQICDTPEKYRVTVFDRRSRESNRFYRKFKNSIEVIYGDISVKEQIAEACHEKEIVIHLAAIIPPLADKMPELAEAVNSTGTRNLVESLEKFSPDAFLIYSSSISVYGDRNKNPWIRITDPLTPSPRDEYAKTKIEAEKIIASSQLKWTIFRLTAIMGTGNHKVSPLMFHMPLDTPMEIASPGDTGRAFVNAIEHTGRLSGNIYNLSGGDSCRISYRDFLSRSFEIMGLGKSDFPEGTFATKNFHCGYYADGDLLNDIIDFRRESAEYYFKNLSASISPARRLITRIFSPFIRRSLEKKSEPLAAIRSKNQADINHYF